MVIDNYRYELKYYIFQKHYLFSLLYLYIRSKFILIKVQLDYGHISSKSRIFRYIAY